MKDSRIYKYHSGKKGLAILIDPDTYDESRLAQVLEISEYNNVDFFLTGGSLTFTSIDFVIDFIKKNSRIPVYIFPGNVMQVSSKADGILLLSLISGRNPEFLIGHHVLAAPKLRESGISIFPTAYILVENGKTTSVEYMSNTIPIPSDKPEIVVATAMAGEMLGLKLCYLEAGSGAANDVGQKIITRVKENISIPVIAGGGIKSKKQAEDLYRAGADIIVAGNAVEYSPELISELAEARNSFQT